MWRFLAVLTALLTLALPVSAQDTPVQSLLQEYRDVIVKSSRKTIGPAIDAVAGSGLAQAQIVLQKWQSKEMWLRKDDGQFFWAEEIDRKAIRVFDFDTGKALGEFDGKAFRQIKPNSGIRALLGVALVQFQLTDPDPAVRRDALLSIERDAEASHLAPLRASIEGERDGAIRAGKTRLERLLTISYDDDETARLKAIGDVAGQISLDVRATLNPMLRTSRKVVAGEIPAADNVARVLQPGSLELGRIEAYDMLVQAGLAPKRIENSALVTALGEHISGGRAGGVPLARLNTDGARLRAYQALADEGKVPALVTDADIDAALAEHQFFDVYAEPSRAVTDAAQRAMVSIMRNVGASQMLDLALDGLSLASIFFLAAIGLAITFGVMGVINMAHGEFIMMGAYTGYVVQQFIPN